MIVESKLNGTVTNSINRIGTNEQIPIHAIFFSRTAIFKFHLVTNVLWKILKTRSKLLQAWNTGVKIEPTRKSIIFCIEIELHMIRLLVGEALDTDGTHNSERIAHTAAFSSRARYIPAVFPTSTTSAWCNVCARRPAAQFVSMEIPATSIPSARA